MAISNRRSFIIRVASASAAVAAGGLLSACGGGDDDASPSARFDFGVASGDPLADRVVLWTHAAPANGQSTVSLTWEVARDAGFTQVVSSGQVQATAAAGFTAKVDATGLSAGQSYHFRFREGRNNSPVGRTRTLPASGVGSVKMAVFSCANYPAGFFHAYSEAVNQGAEYAVHLGDYIYEYPANGYASQDAVALGRVSSPANECLTLADYRARYAQYRSDPDLKRMHASLPLIAVWDDHEIANDAYVTGAENHTEGAEGAFTDRVAAALKVWHEWMPVRTPDMTDLRKIYRSFDFGNLLSLHMLETRLLGRDQGVELPSLVNPATQAAALASLTSASRQMLGGVQQAWLQQQMAASSATWQVLGQQVLMARMAFPVSILQALDPSNTDPAAQAAGLQAITDYLTAKATPPGSRTPTQQSLLDPALNPQLGYNVDAWDGYPVAREVLLGTANTLGKRLVTLAGDTHNAWHSDLTLLNGTKVGEEFATPGVSSPGLEEYLSAIPPANAASIFTGVIDTLNYADTARRGFLLMTFTPTTATGDWWFVSTVKSRSYTAVLGHSAVFNA
ncbi:phoD-like phosphatase family protein [Hydrogenophaga sp. RAC07]|uniref:alkaline phosphatase D family protein n=1 Tax=Hydrogenophaga sp. RAC07 TaxID=1842537 RepID=UPI00083CD1DB|nr:alkaline phosphatase D family protein [Hydrogenophaga sp. RAC07]AOF87750.1 phoD-like phosphatase family protein [Hydrogenophaga sp. RAC07]